MCVRANAPEKSTPRVYGIVPAAGRSRRMGRPKPALPIRGRPMLHRVAESLLGAPLDGIVIVVAEDGRPLAEPLADRCEIVVNPRADAEMIESVQLALRHIRTAQSPRGPDGLLVCPVDAADLSPETIRTCVAAFRHAPHRIVVATHAGRRGHPIVFSHCFAEEILALAPAEGLNQLPRRHPEAVLEVHCDDPGVLRNINTPADYDGLCP